MLQQGEDHVGTGLRPVQGEAKPRLHTFIAIHHFNHTEIISPAAMRSRSGATTT